jgi:hypothetical protein
MIRIAFLILGLAAGFLAGWILRGPDAPSRSAQRQAERLEPAETREGRPESGQRNEERGAHEGDRPATPRRAPRVETAITRQALRAVHKARNEGQEPPADLVDAGAAEVERAVARHRENMIGYVGSRFAIREEIRRAIGEISDSPLLLQGRTARTMILGVRSRFADGAGLGLGEAPLDPRSPAQRNEHRSYVRGGTVPPGRTFVIEKARVVATLATEVGTQVPYLELKVRGAKPWIWNGPPTPFETVLRGRVHLHHGAEDAVSMDLRHGSASIELHGRLLPTAEALALPAAPFAAHSGDGVLDGEPVLLQVFAEHGGGNPNTITLDGRVNIYVDALTTTSLWSDSADVHRQRTSLVHGRGVGRVPAGKVFRVRRIEYRARLSKRDGSHSGFEITVGGKKVVAISADESVDPAGIWTGDVAIGPGEEKRVALTASMHALAEAMVIGDLVDAGE